MLPSLDLTKEPPVKVYLCLDTVGVILWDMYRSMTTKMETLRQQLTLWLLAIGENNECWKSITNNVRLLCTATFLNHTSCFYHRDRQKDTGASPPAIEQFSELSVGWTVLRAV